MVIGIMIACLTKIQFWLMYYSDYAEIDNLKKLIIFITAKDATVLGRNHWDDTISVLYNYAICVL